LRVPAEPWYDEPDNVPFAAAMALVPIVIMAV
jgi:hypothetical protein